MKNWSPVVFVVLIYIVCIQAYHHTNLLSAEQHENEKENRCRLDSFASVTTVGYNSKRHAQGNGALADGCKHVFLDVGSNIGIQIRKLFEPELYLQEEHEESVIHRYKKYFGNNMTAWREEVCAIGFEPNPAHSSRLKQIAKRYSARGWRTTFIFAAVSDHNSVSTYNSPYSTLAAGGRLRYEGKLRQDDCITSNKKSSAQAAKSLTIAKPGGGDVKVPVIDFGEFLFNNIKNRELPSTTSSPSSFSSLGGFKDSEKANVLVKLDVEGVEYDITTHLVLLNNGNHKIIHDKNGIKLKPGSSLDTEDEIVNIVDRYMIEWHDEQDQDHMNALKLWDTSPFHDKWELLDDESFAIDPYPLIERLNHLHRKGKGRKEGNEDDPWSTMNIKEHGAFWRDETKNFNDD